MLLQQGRSAAACARGHFSNRRRLITVRVAAAAPAAPAPADARDAAAAAAAAAAFSAACASRLAQHAHPHTLSLEPTLGGSLPLSTLAFKALLRASLSAARLRHAFTTTPHICLGLVSVGALPAAGPPEALYDAAEAAVIEQLDGAGAPLAPLPGLRRARGQDVVSWARLSDPARAALAAAERLRRQQGAELLTTGHLLEALQQESAAGGKPWVRQLLAELQPQLASVDVAGQPQGEDARPFECAGFLHEQFAASLCSGPAPLAPGTAACLN